MNILLLNPNTRADITDLMLKVGQRAAAPGTSLMPLTAPRGVPYISTRAEAQIGGYGLAPVARNLGAREEDAQRVAALPGIAAKDAQDMQSRHAPSG